MQKIKNTLLIVLVAYIVTGCAYQDGERNIEFAPNMYHSIPLEPYTQVVDDWAQGARPIDTVLLKHSSYANGLSAQNAPKGTIPRADSWYTHEAYEPFFLSQSMSNYIWAGDSLFSPLAHPAKPHKQGGVDVDWATETDFARGKVLFEQFCVHCHGKDGDGKGSVPTLSENYPPVPSYMSATGVGLKNLPEGKMFYSITYGRNAMGSHASQVTPNERWQIIAYIKHFQRKN